MYTRLRLLPALLVFPVSLFAQDSTTGSDATPPFRRGQWAAQFSAGSGFASLGFLKFRSPSRALVLDVRLSGSHSEGSSTDSAGSRFTGLSSDADFDVRFGWRRYRAVDTKVASHFTFGLSAGLDHRAGRSSTSAFEDNGWSAGVFADVGGSYLVTPRFGLGARGAVTLTYSATTTTQQPSNLKSHTWRISGSAVSTALVATLFF